MIKVIFFGAHWCGPCRALAPTIDKAIQACINDSEVSFQKVDIDNESEISMQYNVTSIPTIVYLRDGVEVSRTRGNMSINELLSNISVLKQ